MGQDLKSRRLPLLGAAAVVVITLVALYLLGSVLLVMGISVVIAYALLPLARLLERLMPWRQRRPGLSRGLAIGLIYLAGLGILAGILILVIPPTVRQSQQFIEEFPGFFDSARLAVEDRIDRYAELIPSELRARAEEALADASGILGRAAWQVVSQTLGVISGSLAFILGLATLPMLVFYLMKDPGTITEALYAPFPAALRPFLRDILDIADRTMAKYIRGQLILGLAVGSIVTVGLLLLEVPFGFILGITAGLTELVPIVGPWIGGAVGLLVTLATAPEKIVWVVLLYLAVQLLENTLLVPRIQGNSLNIHPVAMILVIIVGSQFFGLWGVILGPPVVAMAKDIIVYFVQEWNQPAAQNGTGLVAGMDERGSEGAEPEVEKSAEG